LAQRTPVVKSVTEGSKALVRPFTGEGRDVIVGGLLNRIATKPRARATNA